MRSSVDLPHPEGPTSTTNSPSGTARSTWESASVPSGYRLETPLKVREAKNHSILWSGPVIDARHMPHPLTEPKVRPRTT